MFKSKVLCLTLQILTSLTESQIQQNRQPWNYANFDQVPRIEVTRKNLVSVQPPPIQTPVQYLPLSPKYSAISNENQQIIWDKLVANPNTYTTFDNNPNNYENIIRKYDSMVNPRYVNSNYVAQPEQSKRIVNHNNFNKSIQNKGNIHRNKAEKTRRKKEHTTRNNNEKGKKHRKYRQSGEHNRKKKDNKPLGDSTSNDTTKKNTNGSLVINELEEIEKMIFNDNNERKKEAPESDVSSQRNDDIHNNINSQDLLEKDNQLRFDKIRTTKENYKKRNKENHSTQKSKTTPTMEYQTKYFNQEEFNKYLQNFMAGNISNPYYFPNDIYPYRFDLFYRTFQDSMKPKGKNAKKLNKTNKNQTKEENRDTVIEISPTLNETTPVVITTGTGPKKDIYLNLKLKKKDLPPNFAINSNTPETINEDGLKVDGDEEFTGKPFTIDLFNPLEDDVGYYPDFTLFNHAYLTSSEEEELNQIQKHRDYFQNDWNYYADKVKSYVEQSNKKSHQINPRVGFEPDFVTFSRKDERPYSGDVNMNVETIYAPSRVISYSQTEKQTQNDEEEKENFWFKEGDTTIVLSRSMN